MQPSGAELTLLTQSGSILFLYAAGSSPLNTGGVAVYLGCLMVVMVSEEKREQTTPTAPCRIIFLFPECCRSDCCGSPLPPLLTHSFCVRACPLTGVVRWAVPRSDVLPAPLVARRHVLPALKEGQPADPHPEECVGTLPDLGVVQRGDRVQRERTCGGVRGAADAPRYRRRLDHAQSQLECASE